MKLPKKYFLICLFWSAFCLCRISGDGFAASGAEMSDRLTFKEHMVNRLPRGYKVAVADINGDGRPDIVGLATEPPALVWYENPDWERRVITTRTNSNIDLAIRDIDASGSMDIALAYEFGMSRTSSGGNISILKNPGIPDSGWEIEVLDAEPTAHRLAWADFRGNGTPQLLAAPIMGRGARSPLWEVPVRILLFEPESRGPEITWSKSVIDSSLTVLHGICITDFNNDGRDELLTASFEGIHLFESGQFGKRSIWKKTRIGEGEQGNAEKRGSSEIAVGILGPAKRKFLASIEPWHGDKVVVYLSPENQSTTWERFVIDDSFNEGHALITADLDGDGRDEILAGYRGKGTSLFIYRCVDEKGRRWERIPLDEGDMATSGLAVADIDGNGLPDIVAIGTSTNNIKWYENLGK